MTGRERRIPGPLSAFVIDFSAQPCERHGPKLLLSQRSEEGSPERHGASKVTRPGEGPKPALLPLQLGGLHAASSAAG